LYDRAFLSVLVGVGDDEVIVLLLGKVPKLMMRQTKTRSGQTALVPNFVDVIAGR
jgi:hypothetical protein